MVRLPGAIMTYTLAVGLGYTLLVGQMITLSGLTFNLHPKYECQNVDKAVLMAVAQHFS